eukprot:scaffold5144_cov105-Isochrysis_galbana.AAC.4
MARTIATARILMPKSMVRLSAGRMSFSPLEQSVMFLAGANSIFTGDKLLTTANPAFDEDMMMFQSLGTSLPHLLRAHSGARARWARAPIPGTGCAPRMPRRCEGWQSDKPAGLPRAPGDPSTSAATREPRPPVTPNGPPVSR